MNVRVDRTNSGVIKKSESGGGEPFLIRTFNFGQLYDERRFPLKLK